MSHEMDFDLSKENVQPLRGGRNVSQLGVALQAQHSQEYQQELMQQRLEFENAIRSYDGLDPLDNYYHFISWVEQSYPKHGSQGNLALLLEDCIGKFENDKRYANDRRFCKIWIKYIDMQQNPIELFQMLYSRSICKGCADLYRAWAFYHEAVGDFKSADMVFQMGKRELAQPYDELAASHENMIYAAGQQVINGVDERRLQEQRQALTMLKFSQMGRVGSVRTPAVNNSGVFPAASTSSRANAPLMVYQDQDEAVMGAGAPPVSILDVVKKDAPMKENLMRPGTWASGASRRGAPAVHKTTAFTVHEDAFDLTPHILGIQMPQNYPKETKEDFSTWKSDICLPEPDDPNKIPMYCKREVYINPMTEYSIEEVRGRRYLKNKPRYSVPPMETEQALQSILSSEEMDHSMPEIVDLDAYQHQQNVASNSRIHEIQKHSPFELPASIHESQRHSMQNVMHNSPLRLNPTSQAYMGGSPHPLHLGSPHPVHLLASPHPVHVGASPHLVHTGQMLHTNLGGHPSLAGHSSFVGSYQNQPNHSYRSPMMQPHFAASPSQTHSVKDMDDIWPSNTSKDDFDSSPQLVTLKPNPMKVVPFEESTIMYAQQEPRVHPKGSAMKTPFKDLNDEDLAETGSRGGLDNAATAQPTDGAKRLAMFDDDDDSSTGIAVPDVNSPSTELFSLKAIHFSSTPQHNEKKMLEDAKLTKKQLFPEHPKLLSVIFENSGSSSSNASSITKKVNQSKVNNMVAIEEEQNNYHFNLAQNMKANAALRSSLLGNLMDCDTQPNTSIEHNISTFEMNDEPAYEVPYENLTPKEHVPYSILPNAPSDPFKPDILQKLLLHVGFPGRHKQGYVTLQNAPRLALKKEPCYIGNEGFLMEKSLGKGTYGIVYKAMRLSNGQVVALKVQKPPNRWEYYICRELQNRLAHHPLRERFMNVHVGYFCDSTSVLLSDFSPHGSLLDTANALKVKLGRPMKQNLCIHFTIEMLNIVQAMHEAKIIHADIKPDNFVLITIENNMVGLQLIDFGCSIDMSLYPDGTNFTRRVNTEDFVCCEMLDGRPWSYHTDLYCIAATMHVLLFDKYIKVKKIDNSWFITQKIQRYLYIDLWNTLFSTFLNMEEGLPDLEHLKKILTSYLKEESLKEEMRELMNTMKDR